MKTKRYRDGERTSSALDAELRQERLDEYLKATRASFEAAADRSKTLGKEADGVLAGPVVRTR